MSYCKFSKDSDVYMLPGAKYIECVTCEFATSVGVTSLGVRYHDKHSTALFHLLDHMAAGHQVPLHALERLIYEWAEGGDEY